MLEILLVTAMSTKTLYQIISLWTNMRQMEDKGWANVISLEHRISISKLMLDQKAVRRAKTEFILDPKVEKETLFEKRTVVRNIKELKPLRQLWQKSEIKPRL